MEKVMIFWILIIDNGKWIRVFKNIDYLCVCVCYIYIKVIEMCFIRKNVYIYICI